MNPIALRRQMLRWRRHTAALGLILLLGAAIAIHHGGGGAMADEAMTSMPLCTALLVVGAVAVACAVGYRALGRWDTPRLIGVRGTSAGPSSRVLPAARAGPDCRSLCVWRI